MNENKVKKERHHNLKEQNRIAYLFLAVPILLLIVFMLIPMIIAFGLSFTEYDVINPPKFVAVSNFVKLWNDEFFWICLKNTVLYTVLFVPLGLITSLAAALFLNTNRKLVSLFRTFYYIPVLSSTVATATLWFWILNPQLGLLNQTLRLFGITGPSWLYNSKTAMISIVLMGVWAGFGGNMMIFLAGLKGIDKAQYESAKLDGANAWQQFKYITLPALNRTIFLFQPC